MVFTIGLNIPWPAVMHIDKSTTVLRMNASDNSLNTELHIHHDCPEHEHVKKNKKKTPNHFFNCHHPSHRKIIPYIWWPSTELSFGCQQPLPTSTLNMHARPTCPIWLSPVNFCCGTPWRPPYTLACQPIPLKSAYLASCELMCIGNVNTWIPRKNFLPALTW